MFRWIAVALLCSCSPSSTPVDAGPVADAGADAGIDAGPRGWNANEVSILFPVPSDGGLLLPMRGADGGALISAALFGRLGNPDAGLPRLAEGAGTRDVYPDLRVVSARVDPCFEVGGGCQRQIRLVAQALDPADGTFSDAAIHLFYDLDGPAFIDVLARLRALSRATPVTGPLATHPILTRDSLRGGFSDEVRAIILSACSTANLSRFTFMATGRSKNWFFHILDRGPDGGFESSQVIGRGDGDSFTDQGLTHYRMGTGFGVAWFPDALLSSVDTRALIEPDFVAAYDLLAKLANPLLTHTKNVSCAACHATEPTQVEALRDRDAGTAPLAPSAYGPPRVSTHRMGNMHAFSFFFDAPTVSARTANETEEVLRFLRSSAFLDSLSAQDRARLE